MKRTVAVINRMDVNNFGDVLLGRIFVEWLKEFPLRIVCPGAPKEIAEETGIFAIGEFAEADAVLYIGGGYFSEPPGTLIHRMVWGQWLTKNLILPGVKARLAGKPVAIVGPGFGAITNPVARFMTLLLFYLAKTCAVRDPESVRYLRRYGYRGKVVETADAALCLADHPLSGPVRRFREAWLRKASGRKIVLLNLTSKAADITGGTFIVDCLKRLMEDERYLFVAATDQAGTRSSESTLEFFRENFGRFDCCRIHGYESIDNLLGLIEAASLTVTSKLHVGILSVARRTPVLSFPYHDKTIRFYRQAALETSCLPRGNWTRENVLRQFETFHDLVGSEVALDPELIGKTRENKKAVQQFASAIAEP